MPDQAEECGHGDSTYEGDSKRAATTRATLAMPWFDWLQVYLDPRGLRIEGSECGVLCATSFLAVRTLLPHRPESHDPAGFGTSEQLEKVMSSGFKRPTHNVRASHRAKRGTFTQATV